MSARDQGLLAELKRRKVPQTAVWYLGVAFVVMQVVEVVFPYAGLPDRAGSAVLALLTAGFPLAMVLSWAFRLTPPTFRREMSGATAGGGEAVLRAEEMRTDSVAVLPFENLSDDPENSYFSDGVTDDVIASIAHIDGLRVLSRTSSRKFRDAQGKAGEIAGELGVATLITGSVRRMGSRVRVVVEVIDARTDDHLWTNTYDRELEDIFQVQSDIASAVARAVERELSSSAAMRIRGRGTSDGAAYDLYLRGRFLWNQRSEAALSESIRFFERALERDPRFALAHAALADANAVLGVYGMSAPDEAFGAARTAAEAALAIDPQLGEAVTVKACALAVHGWSWREAEAEFKRAIELTPSYATAYQWYATNLLVPEHRFEEARGRLEQAAALDPLSGAIAASDAIVRFYARDIEGAVMELERLAELHPRFGLIQFFLGQSREVLGQPEQAVEALRRASALSEESSEALAALGHALGRGGSEDEAEEILARLRARAEQRYVSPVLLAQVHLGLGRLDETLALLEDAASIRATELIWLGVRPMYDPIRSSPRFQAVELEVGLPRPDAADAATA